MCLFIDQWYRRAGDDLTALLGDLLLMEDGEPSDPAAYEDWTEVVKAVRSGTRPKSFDFVGDTLGKSTA